MILKLEQSFGSNFGIPLLALIFYFSYNISVSILAYFLLVIQIEAEKEIQHLKDRCTLLESACNIPNCLEHVEKAGIQSTAELHLDPKDSLFLLGGFDGKSWLATMDLYCTSQSAIKPCKPMNSVRSYASVVRLNGEIYVFGGGNGYNWYDTGVRSSCAFHLFIFWNEMKF